MAFSSGNKGVKNDINVTPLVDVVLVLLIIFMVITPMLQRGKDVNLPKASVEEDKTKSDPIVLSVTSEGKTYVEANEVNEGDLEAKVRDALLREPGKKVMLKGDERVTVGDVRKVMARARMGGARGVALAVQEAKK